VLERELRSARSRLEALLTLSRGPCDEALSRIGSGGGALEQVRFFKNLVLHILEYISRHDFNLEYS
jgi:hypothetical protein